MVIIILGHVQVALIERWSYIRQVYLYSGTPLVLL